jgi:DNA-binding NarL/FixJ family response regulator
MMITPLISWPHERAAGLLVETFDAPASAYYSHSVGHRLEQRGWPPEHFADHFDEAARWAERHAPTEHPLLRYYLATGDRHCMQVADVPSQFADDKVVAAWNERGRRWGGVQSQLSFPVLLSASAHRAFIVGRTDPYSVEEMVLAHRLQRLLTGLDRQISTFSRWARHNGAPAAEVARCLCLTPRELAVLELLARGLTAWTIGRRLNIAERTVQKHLSRTYGKLGVSDRLAAVQRAQRVGLLRAHWPTQCAGDRGERYPVLQHAHRPLGFESANRALRAGRDLPVAAVRLALARDPGNPLTPREQQVARLVAAGNTNRQIGRALGIVEKTAEVHVHHIIAKLGARSRSEVAAWVGARYGVGAAR